MSRASTPRSKATNTSPADERSGSGPALLLVGGKGGVGKTTCAAALAAAAARQGLRTLLITTDPAPSLADALAVPLGATVRRAGPRGLPLYAIELDAPRAFRRWFAPRRARLEEIAARGTLLDSDDVARLLNLSLPGIDEVAGLIEITTFVESGRYDRVVADTAPTGHTLRLLSMPDTLARVAAVFDAMQAKHRAVVEALRGGWTPDAADALVRDLAHAAAGMRSLLRDSRRTEAWWVSLPEPIVVSETLDGVEALREAGIPIAAVVLNRLTPAPPRACRRCDARRHVEAAAAATLARVVRGVPLRGVHARSTEPRGLAALERIGREIGRPYRPSAAGTRATWSGALALTAGAAAAGLVTPSTRLLLFGGKGGVGKTTCAAAASLALAAAAPRRRVMLVSADPAHSLGDALRLPLGDAARPVPGTAGHVHAREIDASARFDRIREHYADAIDAMFARLAGGSRVDATHDRIVLVRLLDLAPPGLDELVAVADVAGLVESGGEGGLVVLDLAPSGHTLRLLEAPDLVQDWVKALMSVLLKYRALTGLGDLAGMLLGLSKSLGRLRQILRDPGRCTFVAVTRAAALPRLETDRLLRSLRRMGVPPGAVIASAVGRGGCARCRLEARAEARELRALARLLRTASMPLLVAPETAPPPFGVRALRAWARTWRVYDRS